jgi:hypothetical protein
MFIVKRNNKQINRNIVYINLRIEAIFFLLLMQQIEQDLIYKTHQLK